MRSIQAMSNKELLRKYPQIVSRGSGGRCEQEGVGAYRYEKPHQCKNRATLFVNGRDLCSSHAKDPIRRAVRR